MALPEHQLSDAMAWSHIVVSLLDEHTALACVQRAQIVFDTWKDTGLPPFVFVDGEGARREVLQFGIPPAPGMVAGCTIVTQHVLLPELKLLLENNLVVKVMFGSIEDVRLMQQHYHVSVKNVVDLQSLVALRGDCQPRALDDVCAVLLARSKTDGFEPGRFRWEGMLDGRAIGYAVCDIELIAALAQTLLGKVCWSSNGPPMTRRVKSIGQLVELAMRQAEERAPRIKAFVEMLKHHVHVDSSQLLQQFAERLMM